MIMSDYRDSAHIKMITLPFICQAAIASLYPSSYQDGCVAHALLSYAGNTVRLRSRLAPSEDRVFSPPAKPYACGTGTLRLYTIPCPIQDRLFPVDGMRELIPLHADQTCFARHHGLACGLLRPETRILVTRLPRFARFASFSYYAAALHMLHSPGPARTFFVSKLGA